MGRFAGWPGGPVRSSCGSPGIGPAKAARLLAALGAGRPAGAGSSGRPVPRIREPEDVVRLFGPRLRDLQVEEFHLLALDSQSQVLREVLITRGLLNSSLVHPREVFRAAIAEAAAGIIVVHNHPSGDPTPSPRIGRSPGSWWRRAGCWMCRCTTTSSLREIVS